MTNREWLNTLTDEEFAEWCIVDHFYRFKRTEATLESGKKIIVEVAEQETLREIASSNISSIAGVLTWLKKERNNDKQ